MTLQDLKDNLSPTDNDYEQLLDFWVAVNIIILDMNLNMSAKFNTISTTEVDLSQTLEEATGIPPIMNIIMVNGVSWKLQTKESESNVRDFEAEYKSQIYQYKHLVPSNWKLDTYNDMTFDNYDDDWEILF